MITSPENLIVAAAYPSSVDPILAPIITKAGTATITPHKNYSV